MPCLGCSQGLGQVPSSLGFLGGVSPPDPSRGILVAMRSSPLASRTTRIPADQGADSKARGSGMDFTPRVSK